MSKKKKLIRFLLLFLGTVLICVLAAFLFKDAILASVVKKYQIKYNTKYQSELLFKKVGFNGLNSIEIQDLTLKPNIGDTLVSIKKATIGIDFFKVITGNLVISNLELNSGFIQFTKTGEFANYDQFLNKKDSLRNADNTSDYADYLDSFLTKVANIIPEKMNLNQVNLRINNNGNKISFQSEKLTLSNHNLNTSLVVKTNTFESNWIIKGKANPREKTADLSITSSDTSKIRLPFIDQKYNLITSFASARLKVTKIAMSGGELKIEGATFLKNLTVNHPRIAPRDVVIDNADFNFNFIVKSNKIALDTTSSFVLNSIKIKPFIAYDTEKDTIYTLKVAVPKMMAQDFINSLPSGLFPHFTGIKATGNFDYKLDFKFNKNKPNQLVFNSTINKENLKLTDFGATNLNKLNSDFTYQAIDNGAKQRPILVGLQNPMFTKLEDISPYLQKCVLTSEDPSFFSHRGFITEAFKQSIIKNIRTKKFSRGASTISMQLVKNVFLTREKTMSRKLEEILLVYILENNRITSKERMLEVYFNIIEWGPNIYGIGEASNFYFQKKPIDLTLSECIFLATIVPKPKKFMYQFDNQGNLKPFVNKHQLFLRNIMQRRGLIEPQDSLNQSKPIQIRGKARNFLNLKTLDSIPNDSLLFIKDEILD